MTIHDHVAELSAAVAALQTKVTTLQTEVTTLRAGRRRSRLRALVPILTLLCLISLSLTMIPTTRAQSPDGAPGAEKADSVASPPLTAVETEKPAASPNTSGEPLLIGRLNAPSTSTDRTALANPDQTMLMQNTLRVDNSSSSSLIGGLITNRRVAIIGSVSGVDTTNHDRFGVIGASDTGTGVYGYSAGGGGTGVTGIGDGVGGFFSGTRAPIRLMPKSPAGPPTTGQHYLGELYVSIDGHLWFCRVSGSPGEWVRLDLASTFVPLIQK